MLYPFVSKRERAGELSSKAYVAVSVMLVSAFAGCVTTGVQEGTGLSLADVPGIERLLPYMDAAETHNHSDPEDHRAAWNVKMLAWEPFTTDHRKLGRYNHFVVHDGLAFVSAYGAPPDLKPGLLIADISDPADPKPLGSYVTDWTTPIDVSVSEDGKFAALAGHRHSQFTVPSRPEGVDTCTTVPVPGRPMQVCNPFVPAGVELLDVSDPSRPALLARYTSAPSGAHTVKVATIGGELYMFLGSYGFSYANRQASGVEILRYDSAAKAIVPVTRFLPNEPSYDSVFVHDMFVAKHPKTGEWLLYAAYWDGGVVIANVDVPSSPKQIAVWKDFDAATYGNIHFARPMPGLVDGKHYTVAAPEYGSAKHSGESYVLDTTDPTQPKLLARWHLPGDPLSPSSYMHSPHNFDLTPEGLMVIAHYHAGVWVLDLRPVFAGSPNPREIGYVFTVPPPQDGVGIATASGGAGAFTPNVWNALWLGNGRIAASDITTGLYVMEIETAEPGAPPYIDQV